MKRLFCFFLMGIVAIPLLYLIRSSRSAPAPPQDIVVYHSAEGDVIVSQPRRGERSVRLVTTSEDKRIEVIGPDGRPLIGPDGRPMHYGPDLAQAPPNFPPPPADYQQNPAPRESASDIPVPIVPGTRVTDAQIQPPNVKSYPTPSQPPYHRPSRVPPPLVSNPPDVRTIRGRLSATGDRAQADARHLLNREVAEWLAPEVPSSWHVPPHLIDEMIRGTQIKPVEKELGTMYEAVIEADFSPARRTTLVETYQRSVTVRRVGILGGIFAFVLACLTALTGYIKIDESTKGYYTNRLRLVTAGGVGAAGVILYRLLA